MKKDNLTFEEAKFKAAAYCSASEHCLSEVTEKLRKWGVEDEDIPAITDYLVAEKYVDDSRFARFYVRDKFRFNKWGRYKLSMMLKSKDISGEDIDNALMEIDDDEYLTTLIDLLQAKNRTLKGGTDYEKRAKLYKFALSRGFENNAISAALKEL